MSAQGTKSEDDSAQNPNNATGGLTGAISNSPSPGVVAAPQQPIKPKPKSLQGEIHDILLAKAIEATHGLKQLMLPQSVLEEAAKSVAMRMTNEIMVAACRYARASAKELKFTFQDLLDEVLVAKGIAPRKPSRTKAAKKDTKKHKQGGSHGNKPK